MVLEVKDGLKTISKKISYKFKPIMDEGIDNKSKSETIQIERIPKLINRIPKEFRRESEVVINRVPKLISSEELIEDLDGITTFIECNVRKQLSFAIKYNYFCGIEDYVAEARQHVVKRYMQGKFNPPQIIYKKDENGEFIYNEKFQKRIDSRHWARMVATNKIKHIRAFWSTKKRGGGLGRTFLSSELHNILSDQNMSNHSTFKEAYSDKEPTVKQSYFAKIKSENFSGINSKTIENLPFYKNEFKINENIRKQFKGNIGLEMWTTLIEQPKEYIEFICRKIEIQELHCKQGKIKRVSTKCVDPLNLKWVSEFFGLNNKVKAKKILKRFLLDSGLHKEWNVAAVLA